jgi:Domain of unknown function (DUF4136)
MKYGLILVVFLAFILASCSSVSVKYDYDQSKNFSKYKTYRWVDVNLPADALAKNPLIKKRVIEAVNKGMTEKGFTLSESDTADLAVVVHAGSKEKMQITDWGTYGWYNPWWGPYGGQVDVSYYTEGTLVIDLVDMADKELAWRGLATGTVSENPDPEKSQQRIDSIVTQILTNFPPVKRK